MRKVILVYKDGKRQTLQVQDVSKGPTSVILLMDTGALQEIPVSQLVSVTFEPGRCASCGV